ncbi:unnamed protein product [Boreogadus saida]
MALPGDGVQSLGSYFCLIRRRFKRRRTKRSERKARRPPIAKAEPNHPCKNPLLLSGRFPENMICPPPPHPDPGRLFS